MTGSWAGREGRGLRHLRLKSLPCALLAERFISEADSVLAYEDAKAAAGGHEAREESEEEEDGKDVFAPERGNVAFGSAHDGWAFHIPQFAQLYAGERAPPLCPRVFLSSPPGFLKLPPMFHLCF